MIPKLWDNLMTTNLVNFSILAFIATMTVACGSNNGSDGGSQIRGDELALLTVGPEPFASGPDPNISQQWFLRNQGQLGGLSGQDLRLEGLIETGEAIVVAVLDGSIEISHPDLRWRFASSNSFSYRNGLANPSPPRGLMTDPFDGNPGGIDDAHGTAVAGIIAATASNGIGGRGVAPRAKLVGFDVLVNPSVSNLADAVARAVEANAAVINNSWGPLDPPSGGPRSFVHAPDSWKRSVEHAASNGRAGKGSVVVFAAGNGGENGDRSDYDEYTNDINVISVGAVDDRGVPICFSEPGANVLVAGFSGVDLRRGSVRPGIFTTDLSGPRGYSKLDQASALADQDYTQLFDGTSAAAPMVSGIVALMLEANSTLSRRDIRWILASTARASQKGRCAGRDLNNLPTVINQHGYQPRIGFGIVDAKTAVNTARTFNSLGEEIICASGQLIADDRLGLIPDDSKVGITLEHRSNSDCLIRRLEAVELEIAVEHNYSGDLRIRLASPNQHSIDLSEPHRCVEDNCSALVDGFRFGIVRFLGENPNGLWTLTISDELPEDAGRLLWWRLTLRGHA